MAILLFVTNVCVLEKQVVSFEGEEVSSSIDEEES